MLNIFNKDEIDTLLVGIEDVVHPPEHFINTHNKNLKCPKYITNEIDLYKGKYVFYLVELSDFPHYKFGISSQCDVRIRRHYRKLNVRAVIKIVDCKSELAMRNVEKAFRDYAKSVNILVTKLGETEIIRTNCLDLHLNKLEEIVKNIVDTPNNQNYEKPIKNNKARRNSTKNDTIMQMQIKMRELEKKMEMLEKRIEALEAPKIKMDWSMEELPSLEGL